MPPKGRTQAPVEPRAKIADDILDIVMKMYPIEPRKACEFIMRYYSSTDLVEIRKDLQNGR